MVKKTTKNIIATPTIITQIETTPVVTTPVVTTPVAKKRGRKSKKELELAQNNKIEDKQTINILYIIHIIQRYIYQFHFPRHNDSDR